MMTTTNHPTAEDLTLFALRALNSEEMAEMRAHVAGCKECPVELAEINRDLALLALDVPQVELPPGSKQRLMAMIGIEQDNVARQQAALESGRGKAADRASLISSAGVAGGAGRASRGLSWLPWAAAAACLALGIAFVLDDVAVRGKLGSATQQVAESRAAAAAAQETSQQQVAAVKASTAEAQEMLSVMHSPDAKQVTLAPANVHPHPSGKVVYAKSKGRVVFIASNMPVVPAGKTYQLWLLPANGSAPISAGTFAPDSQGSAELLMPKMRPGVDAKGFGVTVEPAGGSKAPTLPIMMSGS